MLTLSRWKVIAVIASVIFGLLFTLPNLLPQAARDSLPPFLPKKVLNLGLDLQGGSYLMLEVDTPALIKERSEALSEDVQRQLADEKMPGVNPVVGRGSVTLRVADPARYDDAFKLLSRQMPQPVRNGTGANIEISKLDGGRLRVAYTDAGLADLSSAAVEQSLEIIRKRIDDLGTKEPSITRQGADRIVVQVPGESDPERLKAVIGQTAKLSFQMVDESRTLEEALQGTPPLGASILQFDETAGDPRPGIIVRNSISIAGENLIDAQFEPDQQGRNGVSITFDGIGARRFAEITTRNVGKPFAIVLDGKVLSAPNINEPILGGRASITGNFTPESANNLAIMLRNGALPAPLKVEEQRTVGAELGADAVEAGKISTMVAFVAILIFMVLAYGLLFGGFSVIALVINGLMIIAAMSVTQATLTLPGIAGLILTLAVAVDANVLIYERMRDEFRAGRPLLSAMEAGFSRAMETIIDANLTTLIAAAIMFFFGAGPVRGFAWTLSIGVFTSVLTAVLVTQVLLALWYRTARPKTLPIA